MTGLQKRNITPAQAVNILRKNGIEVEEKEAKVILDFLYFLAKLCVNQHINSDFNTIESHENSGSLYTGKHRRTGG